MPSKIKNHIFISVTSAISFAFVLGGAIWSYFAMRGITSPLVLHFNDAVGVTQVGSLGSVLGIGVLGIIMVGIDSVIALELDSRDKFLGKFLAVMMLAFAVLLFIAATVIISVN